MIQALEPRRLLAATLTGGVLTITGTERNDVIEVGLRNNGRLNVRINSASQNFVYTQITSFVVNALGGNDKIEFNDDNPISKGAGINAGLGNDTVEGTLARDTIFGGSGNDDLEGDFGSDIIYGEGGHDVLDGSNGNDKLFGGSGNDHLEGDIGRDTMVGGPGEDDLEGGTSVDQLTGGSGNDDFDNSDSLSEILDLGSDDTGPNSLITS